MKKLIFLLSLGLVILPSSWLMAKYEQEQLQIETQLQERIEGILSKTLPAKSYLVTVKVEMENRERPISQTNTDRRVRSNQLSGQNQYVLPGVPGKKEYRATTDTQAETKVNGFSAETLVSRITVNILVATDVTPEQIRSLRDIITGSIPFNPLRGDEMQLQTSSLLRTAREDAVGAAGSNSREQSLWSSIVNRTNAPVLLIVGAVMTVLIFFIAFLFGPMRAFLNRLLAVLPRVGEQAAYTVSNAPKNNPAALANGAGQHMNGNGVHDPKEEGTRPFHFVREDQLNKLPILCRSLTPAQCALILAYLPAEWASKVLGVLEPATQTSIMRELSQAREIPSEVVKELEEHVKAKLPYLVGGEEWIQSVYQLTQPQTQRTLLGTLNQQSPELAQALRKKTFFLEDLGTITAGALRLLLQEASYPISALALRDEKADFRENILKRLPVAMREILQQEFDLATDDKTAIADAKNKLLETGRRLLVENRFTLQERK